MEPAPTPRPPVHDLSAAYELIDRIAQLGALAESTGDDTARADDEARRIARGLERILAELERPTNVRLLRPFGSAAGF